MQRLSFACNSQRKFIISRTGIRRPESDLIRILTSLWILPQLINSQLIPILLQQVARFIGLWVEVSPDTPNPIIQRPIMNNLLSLQGLLIQNIKVVDLGVCDITVSEISQQCFLGVHYPLCHAAVVYGLELEGSEVYLF